ncbi:MAG: hypothetical protein KDJ97_25425 [Anaerolineae bacterium]|nr:hypothetical protein [Anaerolineae bacterium]
MINNLRSNPWVWLLAAVAVMVPCFLLFVCGIALVAAGPSASPRSVRVATVAPIEIADAAAGPVFINAPEPAAPPDESVIEMPATATAAPVPTSPPAPIAFNGSGDSVENVQMWNGPAMMQVTGNDESRHFAVVPHTVSGEPLMSMVNTTEPYSGRILLPEPVNRLEISASGNWTVEILPLSSARVVSVPGQVEGSGDEVLVLAGEKPDIATVDGNQAGRHFAVIPFTIDGRHVFGSMVNTTDPYQGQVLLDGEVGILEVTAVGPWSISVEAQ